MPSASDEFLISVNIDDLEWFWTLQKRDDSVFLQFTGVTHILKVKCTEMARDKPGQPAYEIFNT